ncbi:MAG: aldo/keto reductase [Anaerolineae bacterium]
MSCPQGAGRVSRRRFIRDVGLVGAGLAGAAALAGCDRLPLPAELFGSGGDAEKREGMEYRDLGKTGEKVSLLGLGGYHLLEIEQRAVDPIVAGYLEQGGNYIETAFAYGDGDSERKVGRALAGKRDGVFLATKVAARRKADARESLERSLRNLQTDHVDLLFLHAVQSTADLDLIMREKGALSAAEEARDAGRVRFIGISGHGWADVLIDALNRYPFDAVMHNFNYLDRFNYPSSEQALLPLAKEKGVAVVGMKALGDGFLYRSPEAALRYAFTLPVSTMVAGINSLEYLATDMAAAKAFQSMSASEQETLFAEAPELGQYVCRQCGKCMPNPKNVPIPAIFQLEGMADRQMGDGLEHDAEDARLRDLLANWFGTAPVARERYRALKPILEDFDSCAAVEPNCPYGIQIVRKLKIAHAKLGG